MKTYRNPHLGLSAEVLIPSHLADYSTWGSPRARRLLRLREGPLVVRAAYFPERIADRYARDWCAHGVSWCSPFVLGSGAWNGSGVHARGVASSGVLAFWGSWASIHAEVHGHHAVPWDLDEAHRMQLRDLFNRGCTEVSDG